MGGRDIIVIGASAGGMSVLAEMAGGLPPGFPAGRERQQRAARSARRRQR